MATFSYLAKDSDGKTREGVVEAGSEARAVDVLREQNFTVISISAKRATLDIGAWLGKLRGVSEKERREKFEALRQRARELDKELMPVRRKAMGDPQVREAWAEAQRLSIEANEATYRKMAELAPDLAEAIEERKKVQEEMTSAWRGRRGKKQ